MSFTKIQPDRALVFSFFNIRFSKLINHFVHVSLAREWTRLVLKNASLVGKVLPLWALPRVNEFLAARAPIII